MEQPNGRFAEMVIVPECTFVEDGYSPIPRLWLDEGEYGRGLQRFIGVCTDIVPINSAKRTIYLAWRNQKPMVGWWWIGGGMLPGETSGEAAARNFKRETKLEIAPSRLVRRATLNYLWKDRAQEPQNIGCHMKGLTFSLEITKEELEKIQLDQAEYGHAKLEPFDRGDIVQVKCFPSILVFYNFVFPSSSD